MKRCIHLAIMACVCLAGLTAYAQKNEFAADASWQFPQASNLNFSSAVGFQLNYAHRLIGAPGAGLYVEVPFLAGFDGSRSIPSLLAYQNYNSLYFTPGLKLKLLPSFFISPYLAAGVGLAHYKTSDGSASETDFASDYAGGMDVKVFPHLSLRGEVRDFLTTTPGLTFNNLTSLPGHTNNVVASTGVVLRF